MKKVYLIRHGQPDFPGGMRMCLGHTELPLSQTGYAQAAALVQKLPPLTAVFSSPLIRAVQTAQAIGDPVILEDLKELYAGQWDGLTFAEIRVRYPELYAARGIDPSLPLPDSESDESGLVRFRRGMIQAAEAAPGDFAVVAHGGVIQVFLQDLCGVRRKPDYTEIIPLVYHNGRFTLQEER